MLTVVSEGGPGSVPGNVGVESLSHREVSPVQ